MDFIIECLVLFMSCTIAECADYCLHEEFTAVCPDSQVVLMQTARYGRMYTEGCIQGNPESIGCYGDLIDHFDQLCTGQQSCSVPIITLEDKVQTCFYRDRMRFLEANYTCISVHNNVECDNNTRNHNNITTSSNAPHGYLQGPWPWVSDPSNTTISGIQECPWRLHSEKGHTFRIDLIDTSLGAALISLDRSRNETCPVRLAIMEQQNYSEQSMCDIMYNRREITLYTSQSHHIELYVILEQQVLKAVTQEVFYLLHYQVLGCEDIVVPPNTILEGDNTHLNVTCSYTGEVSQLYCNMNQWQGDIKQCENPPNISNNDGDTTSQTMPMGSPSKGLILAGLMALTLLENCNDSVRRHN